MTEHPNAKLPVSTRLRLRSRRARSDFTNGLVRGIVSGLLAGLLLSALIALDILPQPPALRVGDFLSEVGDWAKMAAWLSVVLAIPGFILGLLYGEIVRLVAFSWANTFTLILVVGTAVSMM